MMFATLFLALAAIYGAFGQDNATDTGYDRQPLQQLTENRQQHRKTIDGRLCAAAFVQDDQTYTDCTDARAPDGSSGREWCYVEVQLLGKGPKDWNYCVPPVDYDLIRAKTRQSFESKAAQAEKMIERLDAESKRVKEMTDRYNATCGAQHQAVGGRIDKVETLISRGKHCVEKMEETEARIGLLKTAVEREEEALKKKRAEAALAPQNCELVPGYEDELGFDGIRGAYYANAMLAQAPKAYRSDSQINLVVSGKGPMKGISPHKFSIRWDGYILAPEDGTYIFSTETDCGARVFLNGKSIIVDRMPEPSDTAAHTDEPVVLIPAAAVTGEHKKDSEPQELVGGEKVKIRVEMVHSAHLKASDEDSAVIRLYWRSGSINEEIIPEKYFFTSNSKPPLKVLKMNAHLFDLSLLYDGELAFKSNEEFFVADVPQKYIGRRFARTFAEPTMERFSLGTNVPATIYIASLLNEPVPLGFPEDKPVHLRETDDIMSVYKAPSRESRASESRIFKIHFLELREAGEVSFHVVRKEQPFLLFFEQRRQQKETCGGETESLALPVGSAFQGCFASSEQSQEFSCYSGLNGKHIDQPNGVWKTVGGNGVGEFISIRFKSPVEITELHFKPLDDPVTWPSEITLSFTEDSGDDEQTFSILHSNNLAHNMHRLRKPVKTQYIRAEISGMFVNGENSGGSLEFLGHHCVESATEGDLEEIRLEKCDTTIENLPQALPLESGKQLLVSCSADCVTAPEGYVYGNKYYAPESTICTAALHAGICNAKDPECCKILLTVGGERSFFQGSTSQGITAMEHGPSDNSLLLSGAPKAKGKLSDINDKYAFTFQAEEAPVPEGFLADNGGVKKERNGLIYGWMKEGTKESCPARTHKNPLNSSGIAFPPGSTGQSCTAKNGCEPNVWSVDLPDNGAYRVSARVGSPCMPTTGSRQYNLQVNGKTLLKDQELEKGRYFGATVTVDVKDKTLSFTASCDEESAAKGLCKNAITTLSALVVEKVAAPPKSEVKSE